MKTIWKTKYAQVLQDKSNGLRFKHQATQHDGQWRDPGLFLEVDECYRWLFDDFFRTHRLAPGMLVYGNHTPRAANVLNTEDPEEGKRIWVDIIKNHNRRLWNHAAHEIIATIPRDFVGTVEDIEQELIKANLGPPDHHNQWGSMCAKAGNKKTGLLRDTGRWSRAKDASRHSGKLTIWERTDKTEVVWDP